jgi:hypothetical protein
MNKIFVIKASRVIGISEKANKGDLSDKESLWNTYYSEAQVIGKLIFRNGEITPLHISFQKYFLPLALKSSYVGNIR